MPGATGPACAEGGPIRVGTTGTVGSLMSRELDDIKVPTQAASSPCQRRQTSPVSVLCGASPRKVIQKRSSSNDSSSNSGSGRANSEDDCKPRRSSTHRNTHHFPILQSDCVLADRSPGIDKAKKKGPVYAVEVVDVKCGNPMSSRLRKLGFSKLSETFA